MPTRLGFYWLTTHWGAMFCVSQPVFGSTPGRGLVSSEGNLQMLRCPAMATENCTVSQKTNRWESQPPLTTIWIHSPNPIVVSQLCLVEPRFSLFFHDEIPSSSRPTQWLLFQSYSLIYFKFGGSILAVLRVNLSIECLISRFLQPLAMKFHYFSSHRNIFFVFIFSLSLFVEFTFSFFNS